MPQPMPSVMRSLCASTDCCCQNTNVVNMLDGCALSLPCHNADELPMGLMVWHLALHDDDVLNISTAIEAVLNPS